LDDWEDVIKERRKTMGLPGDPDRPLQWSDQDYYVIATMLNSNLLWVRLQPNGSVTISKWIAPSGPMVAKMKQPIYMIFWGADQMVVTSGKAYRFEAKSLPGDLLTAMDSATPMSEEEIRGEVVQEVEEVIPVPAPVVPEPTPTQVPIPEPTPVPVSLPSPTPTVMEPDVEEEELTKEEEPIEPLTVDRNGQTPPPTVAPTMESDKNQPPPPAQAPTLDGIRSNVAIAAPTNRSVAPIQTQAPTNMAVAGTNTITLPTETGDEGESTVVVAEPTLSPVVEEESKEDEESEGKEEEGPGLLERVTNAITTAITPSAEESESKKSEENLDLNLNIGTNDLEGAQVLEGGAY
jgi:hypothetical protein